MLSYFSNTSCINVNQFKKTTTHNLLHPGLKKTISIICILCQMLVFSPLNSKYLNDYWNDGKCCVSSSFLPTNAEISKRHVCNTCFKLYICNLTFPEFYNWTIYQTNILLQWLWTWLFFNNKYCLSIFFI